MSKFDRDDGVSRRKVLECMTWVGTGVLWTDFRRRSALAGPYRRGGGAGSTAR